MAGPLLADRIKETTTTTGTGTLTLLGAATGFRSFSTFADGDTCYYVVVGTTGEWEVGLGTVGAVGTTLARTTLLSSSTGSAVSFAAGTKQVLCDQPANAAFTAARLGTVAHATRKLNIVGDIFTVFIDADGVLVSPNLSISPGSTYSGLSQSGLILQSIGSLAWESSGLGARDVFLLRGGAGVLIQSDGANAQEFRVSGTTTGSKYASLSHDGTNPILGSSSGGLKANSTAITPASTGTRYLIIDANGLITSSASAPSGT